MCRLVIRLLAISCLVLSLLGCVHSNLRTESTETTYHYSEDGSDYIGYSRCNPSTGVTDFYDKDYNYQGYSRTENGTTYYYDKDNNYKGISRSAK